LKLCKAALDHALIAAAPDEIADAVRLLFGPLAGWTATAIACGHFRRPDCFGKRLGQVAVDALDLPFAELWEDRLVSGFSHPKEFRKLPRLTWRTKPAGPVLTIDDLATSGRHMEEALTMVRGQGLPAFGIV
jgi:hypothetical protein